MKKQVDIWSQRKVDHPPCRLVMIVINLFLTTSVLNDVISKNIYEGKRVFSGNY